MQHNYPILPSPDYFALFRLVWVATCRLVGAARGGRWPRGLTSLPGSLLLGGLALVPVPARAQTPQFAWATPSYAYFNQTISAPSAVDRAGNTYLTGRIRGTTVLGTTTLVGDPDGSNLFLAKLDKEGRYLWAVSSDRLPGGSADAGTAITVDSVGNVYLAGFFDKPSMRFAGTTLYSFDETKTPTKRLGQVTVMKLTPDGRLLWAAQGGDVFYNYATAIAVDKYGSAYITGNFNTSESVFFGNTTLTADKGNDYIAKLSPAGQWLWAVQGGNAGKNGEGHEKIMHNLALDQESNVYLLGRFGLPTAVFGSITLTNSSTLGREDLFVAKLTSNGQWLWAAQAKGTAREWPTSLAVDAQGNAYVTGDVTSNAPARFGVLSVRPVSPVLQQVAFVAKLSPRGQWLWVKLLDAPVKTTALKTDWLGNVLLAGHYNYTGFVAKYFASGQKLWEVPSSPGTAPHTVHVEEDGSVTVGGSFTGASAVFGSHVVPTSPYPPFALSYFTARLRGDQLRSQAVLCPGDVVQLTSLPGTQAWVWSTGETTPTISVSGPGQYWVICTYPNGDKLRVEHQVALTIPANLTFSLGPNTTICADESLLLRAPVNRSAQWQYRWSDNSTDTLLRVTEPGLYWLEVSGPCSSFRNQIRVDIKYCLQLPNVITPDQDGLNDTFRPRGLEPGDWELVVFNRWGRRVYESPAYTGDWGPDVPAGVYYYQLRHSQSARVHKGWIDVVR